MTLLDRYLFRHIVAALFKTLLALVLLYELIDLLTHRRDVITRLDVPWSAVFAFYAVSTPHIVYQMAPLAMLVSALLVLGQAAQNNEVTAALAGGVSLRRFVRMPVVVALLLTLGVFAMDQTVGAPATARALTMEKDYFGSGVRNERGPVSWANLAGHWTVYLGKFNRLALTGEDVIMYSIRSDAVEYIRAKRIYWYPKKHAWILERGLWSVFAPSGGSKLHPDRRITQTVAPIKETPEQLFALDEPPRARTASELASDIRHARARGMSTQRAQVNLDAKFSQPALCFVMIWLAIPFAMRLRRGGLAISFGMSVAIAIAYLIVFMTGMQLGYIGRISPFVAAWAANILFLGAGLVLFWRTPT